MILRTVQGFLPPAVLFLRRPSLYQWGARQQMLNQIPFAAAFQSSTALLGIPTAANSSFATMATLGIPGEASAITESAAVGIPADATNAITGILASNAGNCSLTQAEDPDPYWTGYLSDMYAIDGVRILFPGALEQPGGDAVVILGVCKIAPARLFNT